MFTHFAAQKSLQNGIDLILLARCNCKNKGSSQWYGKILFQCVCHVSRFRFSSLEFSGMIDREFGCKGLGGQSLVKNNTKSFYGG
ncbi:hypothetical protein HMPREF0322_02921 [Desulfitobacterium hafniense DP7]|uniref:Uncharacterized protein n=2 Tax=Desulfitobacterium hafniense TaxID=49338 RepID=Q24U62_DESHY|nr:hypothetical protein HMPREF0322_02921 [Desulfitobacterium hafniense DP7]BAE84430.1 hypothetical protein DSY2641 [Desulfitobacterium hafniense Y51]